MNNDSIVNIAGPALNADALQILRAIPGVTAEQSAADGADAVVAYAGTTHAVAVEYRKRVNAATAHQLIHDSSARESRPLLVIAGETTADARALLEDHDVALIDGLGYVHVELPGLLLHLEGRRASGRAYRQPARLRGKAGVAAQALLLERDRDWRVNQLAERAAISAGLAHRVLARLDEEGIAEATGKGPLRTRRIVQPGALLDLWAEEDLTQARTMTAGYALAQTTGQLIEHIGEGLAAAGITYAFTAAAGASLVASFVTAIPIVEVWVPAATPTARLLDAAGATPVGDGHNILFLQMSDDTGLAFAADHKGLSAANMIRLYGDLRRDPRRGAEQAQRLREEILEI